MMSEKRPNAWRLNWWILYADNTPVHTSLLVCQFFDENETIVIPHPPYFPNLVPPYFFLQIKNEVQRLTFSVVLLDKVEFTSRSVQYRKWRVRALDAPALTHGPAQDCRHSITRHWNIESKILNNGLTLDHICLLYTSGISFLNSTYKIYTRILNQR